MEILNISSDSNESIAEPKELNLENEILKPSPKLERDLDYLFNKYLGDKKAKSPEITSHARTDLQDAVSKSYSSDVNECNKRHNDDLNPNFEHELNSFDNGVLPRISKDKKCKMTSHDYGLTNFITNSETHECEGGVESSTNPREEQKKIQESIRREKSMLKEQKKEQDKRNKAMKDALATHYRNMKPENCIKFIKVQIDEALIQEEFSRYIIGELQKNGISFITKSHDISSIITWKTHFDTHLLDSNGQLFDASEDTNITEVLLIIKWNDFIVHIHNNTFLAYVENVCANSKGRKIILAIYGLGRYYQYHKTRKNRAFKEDISSKTFKNSKDDRIYANIPTVSRRAVEYALTEIQLLYSISHKMIENEEGLASFVYQLTKSIAQEPYKKEKQEQFIQSRWFMSEDNKNCIKVDKNGNGLPRLWKQIITTFPLASLETAEAISAIYPTPLSLFEAYKNIFDTNEGEKLLQDIPIRRAAGPISLMRKIGPELSRKMYHFFTSINPADVL